MMRTWQRLLDPAEPMHAAVAVAAGDPVGLAHFIQHRSCWTIEDSIYLQDLFVDASCRGQGIGRALIGHVYAEASARECTRIWWLTHETNAQARRLYESVADRTGFIQYRKAP
jgi:GNAT superfamily N-acetyltransferase